MATKENTKSEPVEAEVVYEQKYVERVSRGGFFWGFLFIALGVLLIAESFTDINLWQYFWPGVLILLGLSIVVKSFRN